MVVDVHHSEKKVTKDQIREYIKTHFKKQHVVVFGLQKSYGGGRTKGFCLVYDNEDALKKNEPAFRTLKSAREKMSPADRKKKAKKDGRKTRKIKKHQSQKKFGTVRKQEKKLAQKQKKKQKK